MKSLFSRMFSISGEERRSFTFWVAPVGTPPHLRKRFQISALYAAVCSSFSKRWNSSAKYHVARPWLRFWVTRPHIWSWIMSIPNFFNCFPNSLMSKATSRLWMSTFVLWLNTFSEPDTYRSNACATRSASGKCWSSRAWCKSERMGIFSGQGLAR